MFKRIESGEKTEILTKVKEGKFNGME